MGARTKYNETTVKIICERLQAGCSRRASYTCADVSQDTFLNWIKRYPKFAEHVNRAESEAEVTMSLALMKAANGVKTGFFETRTTKVFRPRTVRETRPNGTVIETNDYVECTETTTVERSGEEFDWKAAESWLKRRRPADWRENIDVTSDGKALHVIGIEVVPPPGTDVNARPSGTDE